MGFFRRLLGLCRTRPPADPTCWELDGHQLRVKLSRAPELTEPGGAIRLEGDGLPDRVLIVHGRDGLYHAFRNRCTHGGRRIDPVTGSATIQCCSIGKSTFDYDGQPISGTAESPLTPYPVRRVEDTLLIDVR